jgi:hypothetical protein
MKPEGARLETPPLWHSNWSPAKWRLSGAPYYVRPRHARDSPQGGVKKTLKIGNNDNKNGNSKNNSNSKQVNLR